MAHKIPKTPLATRLSGDAKETELRIRSILQWKKRRPPFVLLALAILLALCCGGLVSCQSQEDVLHMGLDAEVIEIDAENMVLYVRGVGEEAEIFGQRCALDCKKASEKYQLIYVDYENNDVSDISFTEFQVGDSVIVSMYESQRNRAKDAAAQAEQVQLGTQREIGKLPAQELPASSSSTLIEVEKGRFVDADGRLQRYEYVDMDHGNCYNLYSYDEAGLEKTVVSYKEDGTLLERKERFYDETGRRSYTEYTQPINGKDVLVTKVEYDENEEPVRFSWYYENGTLKSEMLYELRENDQLTVTIQEYDEQGRLTRYYRGGGGEPEIEKKYNQSGIVIYEEKWTDQQRHTGEKIWYDDNGNVIRSERYEKDVLKQ